MGEASREEAGGNNEEVQPRIFNCAETKANSVVRAVWNLFENRSEAGQDQVAIRYIYIFRREVGHCLYSLVERLFLKMSSMCRESTSPAWL